MSSKIAIHLQGVSKQFPIFSSQSARLLSLLTRRSYKGPSFEAVKPLDLIVEKGKFLGIIGENGSGKSTLLQIIAGILSPSTGEVIINGRVGALLELGAGFNPDFTGRENAKLNAAILGLTDLEFEAKLPEIIAFADIGNFFDMPVKTYSSGMYVRLAFAVQACIEPDILIVDEALAVGDIFFRLKCYQRLDQLRRSGCTVILVTHSMEDVMHYCDSAILLNNGSIHFQGDVIDAVNHYYALGNLRNENNYSLPNDATELIEAEDTHNLGWPSIPSIDVSREQQVSDGAVKCLSISLADHQGNARQVFKQGEQANVFVEFEVTRDLETVVGGIVIRTEKGMIVHGKHSGQAGIPVPSFVKAGTRLRCHHEIELALQSGEYLVDVTIGGFSRDVYEAQSRMTMAELETASHRHCVISGAISLAVVPPSTYGFDAQPFYGLVDLNSKPNIFKVAPSEGAIKPVEIDD